MPASDRLEYQPAIPASNFVVIDAQVPNGHKFVVPHDGTGKVVATDGWPKAQDGTPIARRKGG